MVYVLEFVPTGFAVLPLAPLYQRLTVMDCVVAPVDQRYALAAGAVNVTDPPSQKFVGPLAEITGTSGRPGQRSLDNPRSPDSSS